MPQSSPAGKRPATHLVIALNPDFWPHIINGQIKPRLCKAFSLTEARAAHELMEAGQHIGKIILLT
ncbi:zinc-binding dehydrogenase [Pseudomonas sp. NPDC086566]|uniref:zinc-binding dehydrogenase n=1 Tax=Pseudomonas sp. NPDC086566 TaxID=3390647 RepID=UPI003D0140E8